MDEFEIELKKGFLEEATQMLSDAEQCFLVLESNPDDTANLEKIFRIAHNIKGSSKAVGFDQLGSFTHEFESLFLKVKNKQVPVTAAMVGLLLRCNDQIKMIVDGLKEDLNAKFELENILVEIRSATNGELVDVATHSKPDPVLVPQAIVQEQTESSNDVFSSSDLSKADLELMAKFNQENTIQPETKENERIKEIPVEALPEKLEEVTKNALGQVKSSESNTAVSTITPIASKSKSVSAPIGGSNDESIRVSLSRLEKLINFVGEMSILQSVLNEQVYGSNPQLLRKTAQQLGKVCKEVQDISMSLRMVPVKQTFQKMQRIVRDTSSILGKKVNLVLEGEETELDKTVLEAIGDPLVHLVRNSVDHGIESADVRKSKGKSEQGTVWLRALHQSGKLVLEVEDDGGGIDGQKLLAKAIEKGVLKPGTIMSEKDAVNLIFHPGFSTKSQVSEVSGRGVGMDVVKTNIEHLQGEVSIVTEVGKGTILRIQLPLTLAIIDGMVVENIMGLKSERFVVPLSHVHESLKPKPGELHQKTGIGEVLQLRGEVMPAYRLSSLLSKGASNDKKEQIALIFRNEERPFAVMVGDILRQQQVVVKQLGAELKNTKGFSGSAILGDGKPALILEMPELIQTNKVQGRQIA